MKIGVASTNLNFFGSVLEELQKHHEIMMWKPTQDMGYNMYQLGVMQPQIDVWFVDFAQSPLDIILQMKKPVVVRMHRIEMYNFLRPSNGLTQANWNNTNVIFSCEHVRDRFFDYVKDLGNPQNLRPRSYTVIHTNSVDLDLFYPRNERTYEKPYQMCMVGYLIPKKRIYDLIQTLPYLPDWDLNIVGSESKAGNGCVEYWVNCCDLAKELDVYERLHSIGQIPHESLPAFYSTQDIIVSNSNEEGTHVSISEAMACGVKPLLNCWRGVRNIYDADSVFRSQMEFVDKVKTWERSKNKDRISEDAVGFIRRKYDSKVLSQKVRTFIEGVVR